MSKIADVFGDQFPLALFFLVVMALIGAASVNPDFTQMAHDAFMAFAGAAGMRALPARKVG